MHCYYPGPSHYHFCLDYPYIVIDFPAFIFVPHYTNLNTAGRVSALKCKLDHVLPLFKTLQWLLISLKTKVLKDLHDLAIFPYTSLTLNSYHHPPLSALVMLALCIPTICQTCFSALGLLHLLLPQKSTWLFHFLQDFTQTPTHRGGFPRQLVKEQSSSHPNQALLIPFTLLYFSSQHLSPLDI